MSRVAVVVIAVMLARVGTTAAYIQCASRSVVIAPAGGAVGPEPTLYVFRLASRDREPHRDPTAIRVEDADGPVPFTAVDRSSTEAVVALELRIHRRSGAVTVDLGDGRPPAHYTLDGPAPRSPPPRIEDRTIYDRAKRCAGQCCYTHDGLDLTLEARGALAFRIAWRDGTTSIVPRDRQSFNGSDPDTYVHLMIGTTACEAGMPRDRTYREIAAIDALYVDGSVQRVEGLLPLLTARRSHRNRALAGGAFAAVAALALGIRRRRRRVAAAIP